jgi:hypothetical protein
MAKRDIPKILVDNHLSVTAIQEVLSEYRVFSAATISKRTIYAGSRPNDEDFTEILQRAWEHEMALISADGQMINNARLFNREAERKVGRESCLRGVIVVPRPQDLHIKLLQQFESGEIAVVAVEKGLEQPRSIARVFEQNSGVDLRKSNPHAVNLCSCAFV